MTVLGDGRPVRQPRRPTAQAPGQTVEAPAGEPPGFSFDEQRDLLNEELLTEADKEAIRAQVREDFIEERRKEARQAFYKEVMHEQRKQSDPNEMVVPIFLQLPGSASHILLDGKQYFTDTVYPEVPLKRAHVLIEQMTRAWAHEEQTEVRDSKGRRRWRPPPGVGFGNHMDNRIPRNMTLSTAQMAGAIGELRGVMQASEGQWSS